jgi:glutamyl-tRNA synthetase
MTEVRTRFAPSPTGFQHIGGMRTAFYAWLLAKKHGGKFILRVEDTDQERKVPGAIRFIIDELRWFGIEIDEGPSNEELAKIGEPTDGKSLGGPQGPYIQSLRLARYKEVAEELVAKGFCYRCDCTPEMLEKERNEQMARKEAPGYSGYCRDRNVSADTRHVIRLKLPAKRSMVLEDAIRGRIEWEDLALRDPVLLKSDGFPTYHLAVVVDDHDMKVTHVMRGTEWVSTTPIHLLLYEALGWKPPVFAHLPVIMGSDGKKLSKRHGAVTSETFREQGYLPEALLNFVTLIGWAPGEGDNQEIFTREELIQKFSLEGVNSSSGVFDYNKLLWMNGMYIRALSPAEFTERAKPYLEKAGIKVDARWEQIAPHVQERVKILSEIAPMVDFIFQDKITRELPAMFQKGIDAAKAIEVLERTKAILSGLPSFSHELMEPAFRALADELGLKAGPCFGVIRIAVTGKKVTPPLFESIAVLGKATTLARIDEAIAELRAAA